MANDAPPSASAVRPPTAGVPVIRLLTALRQGKSLSEAAADAGLTLEVAEHVARAPLAAAFRAWVAREG